MNNPEDFSEVLDILKLHGDEIMMAFHGEECMTDLKRDLQEEFEAEKDNLIFYSCYEGGKFLPLLFGIKNYDQRNMLDNTEPELPSFQKGFIYHCLIQTFASKNDYISDQNHYFTIFCGERTLLFQTYGGAKGILVKYIHGNIKGILKEILQGNTENYRRLFEIPSHMELVLSFRSATLKYVSQKIFYPSLIYLNGILSTKDLDFAANKLDYLI
jgi:hypothetical protein